MSIPNVRFSPTDTISALHPGEMTWRQLGFTDNHVEDLCECATSIYRMILSREMPDILRDNAPREVLLGGFERRQGPHKSGPAAYVKAEQTKIRLNDAGEKEVPLKEQVVTMRVGIQPSDLHSQEMRDQIENFFAHECIHLATQHAISSLMRGPNEAMVMGIQHHIATVNDSESLLNKDKWGWRRELSRSTNGFCPPDFEDIDFYNETIDALYLAAANAFQNESETQLWAFAARLTEIALRKNAAPVKAEIDQVVHEVFPETADAILRSPAFKQISNEGFQIYWLSNAKQQQAVFYPYDQRKVAAGESKNALATYALRPVRVQFKNTFFKKGKIPMKKSTQGGGELLPGEIHTVESIRQKLSKTGNPQSCSIADQMGGVSIQVPGTSQTANIFDA